MQRVSERGIWIAIGVVAALVLGGGCCLCTFGGGFAWLVAGAADADASDARAQREGFERGPGLTGDECFRDAVARRMACGGYVDPNCASQATAFLTACLQTSTRVDPSLCADLPSGFMETSEWSARRCQELGHEPGSPCEDVPFGIEAYCRAR